MGVEYYCYFIKIKKIEYKEKKFLENFEIVKEYFKNFEEQFNNDFFNDLRRKVDNMLYYSILNLMIDSKNDITQITNNYIFPEDIEKSNFSLDIDLKKIYKTNYIDREVLTLLNSLGTKWYKCPNNHLYTVGECGRPMEESICPQCKEKIGGRQHIPASGNVEININNEINNINNNQRQINNNNTNKINNNQNNNQNRYQNNNQNRYQNINQNNNQIDEENKNNIGGDCNII